MKLTDIEEANGIAHRLQIAISIGKKLSGPYTSISFAMMHGTSNMQISTNHMRNAIGLEIADLNARLEKLGVKL
jgi:hypothetical protein